MKRIWGAVGSTSKLGGGDSNVALKEDMKLREDLLAALAGGQLREEELSNKMYKPGFGPEET